MTFRQKWRFICKNNVLLSKKVFIFEQLGPGQVGFEIIAVHSNKNLAEYRVLPVCALSLLPVCVFVT